MNALSLRTQVLLQMARKRVQSELAALLNRLLVTLENSIQQLNNNFHYDQFTQSLTDCRTAIQTDLEIVAGWFNLANNKEFKDFNISLAMTTGQEIIRQLHPTAGRLDIKVKTEVRCAGGTFEPLVYILLILFDNMIRHSGTGSGVIEVGFSEGIVQIEASNPLAASVDLTKLKTKLSLLSSQQDSVESRAFLRKEGGSGYHKIRKLLRVDLNGSAEENDVQFEILEMDFRASIRIRIKELQA
jgi:hypothetical protein